MIRTTTTMPSRAVTTRTTHAWKALLVILALALLAPGPAGARFILLDTTFDKAIDHLAPLEPKVRSFVPERTKTSLVPFYGNLADNL